MKIKRLLGMMLICLLVCGLMCSCGSKSSDETVSDQVENRIEEESTETETESQVQGITVSVDGVETYRDYEDVAMQYFEENIANLWTGNIVITAKSIYTYYETQLGEAVVVTYNAKDETEDSDFDVLMFVNDDGILAVGNTFEDKGFIDQKEYGYDWSQHRDSYASILEVYAQQSQEQDSNIADGYSDEDILSMVKGNYYIRTGQLPSIEIDHEDGNEVTVHVYEDTGDHAVTLDWYTVDRTTGMATNMLGEQWDLVNGTQISSTGNTINILGETVLNPGTEPDFISYAGMSWGRIGKGSAFSVFGINVTAMDAAYTNYDDGQTMCLVLRDGKIVGLAIEAQDELYNDFCTIDDVISYYGWDMLKDKDIIIDKSGHEIAWEFDNGYLAMYRPDATTFGKNIIYQSYAIYVDIVPSLDMISYWND